MDKDPAGELIGPCDKDALGLADLSRGAAKGGGLQQAGALSKLARDAETVEILRPFWKLIRSSRATPRAPLVKIGCATEEPHFILPTDLWSSHEESTYNVRPLQRCVV